MLAGLPSSPPDWLIALFPIFFVAMWGFVSVLLSRMSGWHRLGQRFRTYKPAVGKRFVMQGGNVGPVQFSGCLTIHTSDEGMHLVPWLPFRLAHPPLFIPWEEFHQPHIRRFLWSSSITADVGSPPITKLRLNRQVFEGYESRIGLQTCTSKEPASEEAGSA